MKIINKFACVCLCILQANCESVWNTICSCFGDSKVDDIIQPCENASVIEESNDHAINQEPGLDVTGSFYDNVDQHRDGDYVNLDSLYSYGTNTDNLSN